MGCTPRSRIHKTKAVDTTHLLQMFHLLIGVVCVCVCMSAACHNACIEVRGQLGFHVGFLLPLRVLGIKFRSFTLAVSAFSH